MRSVEALLGRRLDPSSRAPLAVAFSGGGNSLALLLLAKVWADRHQRPLVALTVDHGLQPQASDWARWCAERAGRLAVGYRTLVWEGGKPASGLPAAARLARHRLLADAAREAGAAVILMGHTGSDLGEAAAMRAAGSTTPSPRDWTPSPVWPQGGGLFLLRPLLCETRAGLRAWLTARGETWLEDPANDDPRFARARARAGGGHAVPDATSNAPLEGAEAVDAGADGALRLPADASPAVLAVALVCAGGGVRLPRRAELERAAEALTRGEAVVLAGGRAARSGGRILVCREAGDLRRRGAEPLALAPGGPIVWDGRYEILTDSSGLTVRPLAGLAARLSRAETAALKAVAPAVRRALPAIVTGTGAVTCPILAQEGPAAVRSLVLERFAAASGLIGDEAAIWRVAKAGRAS